MTYEEMIGAAEEYYSRDEFDKALPIFKELAEDGEIYGVFRLAECYTYGYGVEQNLERALRLAQRAEKLLKGGAEGFSAEAISNLIAQLEEAINTAEDNQDTDADPGQTTDDDFDFIAYIEEENRAKREKLKQMQEHFDSLIQNPPKEIRLSVAPYALNKLTYEKRVTEMEDHFNNGDYDIAYKEAQSLLKDARSYALSFSIASANYILSLIYHDGLGNQNLNVKWSFAQMKIAAILDYTPAYCDLAEKYAAGDGCDVDYSEARYWARRALSDLPFELEDAKELLERIGSEDPEPDSAILCNQGINLIQQGQKDEGKKLMRQAALCENPDIAALSNMAILSEGDWLETLRWRKEAALCGDKDSCLKLAFLYLLGDSNPQGDYSDWEQALYWMEQCEGEDYENCRGFIESLKIFLNEDIDQMKKDIFDNKLLGFAACFDRENRFGFAQYVLYLSSVLGHPQSMYNLATLLSNMATLALKCKGAYWMNCFVRSMNDRLGSYYMALYYHEGILIAKNDAQARYWAEKANTMPETDRDKPFIGNGLNDLLAKLANVSAAPAPIEYELPSTFETMKYSAVHTAAPTAQHQSVLQNTPSPQNVAVNQNAAANQNTAAIDPTIPREIIPVFSERRKEYAQAYEHGMELYRTNDFAAALPLVQTAANHGYADAMYALSIMWLNGLGVPQKNERFSFTWMQKSAFEGYTPAYQPLMYKYYNGVGTVRDTEEARFWAQKALSVTPNPATQQILNACGGIPVINQNDLFVADDAIKRNDYATAITVLLRLAYTGHPKACNNLSLFYNNGYGVERNPLQAFRWMREAAERGNKESYRPLVIKYIYGNGTAINPDAAQRWRQIMQEQNVFFNPVDQSLLTAIVSDNYKNAICNQCCGEWLKNGHAVECFEWQYHMAEAGNVVAMKNLSSYYANGQGIARDDEKSRFWAQRSAEFAAKNEKEKAAKAQNSTAANDMFLMPGAVVHNVIADCEEGIRLFNEEKYRDALVYLERAAKEGYGDALYYISLYYTNGILVEKDPKMGTAFYIEALFHNSPAIINDLKKPHYLDSKSSWYDIYKYLTLKPGYDNALTAVKLEKSKEELMKGFPGNAAAYGNPDAMCMMDKIALYKAAAAIGHSYAWFKLGEYYANINRSVSNACFIEGAKRGCEEAKSACALRNLSY